MNKIVGSILLEPIGSVPPKVNSGDEINYQRSRIGQSLSITAYVQSFPVPAYLWVAHWIFQDTVNVAFLYKSQIIGIKKNSYELLYGNDISYFKKTIRWLASKYWKKKWEPQILKGVL